MNPDKKNPPGAKKGARKKKYAPPTLKIVGNLLDASENIWVQAMISCCLTQRLELARRSSGERSALMSELARMIAA